MSRLSARWWRWCSPRRAAAAAGEVVAAVSPTRGAVDASEDTTGGDTGGGGDTGPQQDASEGGSTVDSPAEATVATAGRAPVEPRVEPRALARGRHGPHVEREPGDGHVDRPVAGQERRVERHRSVERADHRHVRRQRAHGGEIRRHEQPRRPGRDEPPVPLNAAAADLDRAEPAVGRRRLRPDHAHLPGRQAAGTAPVYRLWRDRPVGAAVHVCLLILASAWTITCSFSAGSASGARAV